MNENLKYLPPANTERWIARRKARVVHGVRSGLLTLKEACERYRLSEDEFQSWVDLFERHGARGLRSTRMQEYRPRALRGEA